MKWFVIVAEDYSEKEVDKIINGRLSASSQQARKRLKSELKKLLHGFGCELGKWINDKQAAIKEFLPEYHEAALSSLLYHPESEYEQHQKTKMYNDVASSFRENIKNPKMKYNTDED